MNDEDQAAAALKPFCVFNKEDSETLRCCLRKRCIPRVNADLGCDSCCRLSCRHMLHFCHVVLGVQTVVGLPAVDL